METNKKLLVNVFLSLAGIFAFSLAVISRNENVYRDVRGEYTPYSIVLETNKNKIGVGAFSPTTTYSGNGFATTELGNQVAFEYNQLYNPTNYWQTIKAGGYITNTQPIMGMSSISLTKSSSTGNFGIYWSNTKIFTSERYVQFDTSSPLNVTTDFDGYMPNYIKIVAIANSSLVGGVIEFSCADNYQLNYNLIVTSENLEMGTVSGSGQYDYDESVTISATPNEGFEFIGWYQGSTLKSSELVYTFTMPYNALSLEARFVTQYNVDISSFDETLGTVSGGGAHGYTTSVTITATPTWGNVFVAWYDDNYNIVSENASYTFTMPKYDVTFYAEFKPLEKGDTYQIGTYPQSKVTDTTLLSTLNAAGGALPTSANSQAWTDYGYYISDYVSSYMWYIDIRDETDGYRGVYFTSYRPYYTGYSSSTEYSYQDNNGYTTSSVYWFKYEPITWRVLDVQSDKAFLMADLVLDSQDYHYSGSDRTIGGSTVYPNNYKESHIRSWLNDNFYNTAFTAAEKARIRTTTVDNSVASTGYSSNTYACANTSDQVFLLSYAEATSATYGLGTATSRQLKSSAYAQSQGVSTNTSNGNSIWWLRSPYDYYAYTARVVSPDGYVFGDNVRGTSCGVVPALWISLQGNHNPRRNPKWPERHHFVIAEAILKIVIFLSY